MLDWEHYGLNTRAIRAGQHRGVEQEHAEPIYTTSSYVFNSAAEAAAKFAHTEPGNIYSRFTNPTVRIFEERLAAMEGGETCVATSSGMAAILSLCLAVLNNGDRIVSSQSIFGTTVNLFSTILSRFGIQTTFVPLNDIAAWEAAVTVEPKPRLLFLESPSNPLTEVADIRALANLAHCHGALLAVDNCFCTPALQQPLKLGADIVVHSATKYLDGQGRCIGGAVVGNGETVGKSVYSVLRSGGMAMSPFNAWVFLKGLETLRIRMQAHCVNTLALAQWLQAQAAVEKVYYCGLPEHPQYALAQQQQSGFGGLLSFSLHGGKDAAWHLIDNTRLLSITANLGDVKTTITHPATTTHGRMTPEQRQAAGIGDGLVRIAVGLEDVEDIQADLLRGLSH